jgi:hypothetical protein
MKVWNVYLNSRLIDTVFTTNNTDLEECKTSLINHDGYNPSIVVKLVKKSEKA